MRQFFSLLLWLLFFLFLIAGSNYFLNKQAYLNLYDIWDVLIGYIGLLLGCLLLLQYNFKYGTVSNLMTIIVWLLVTLIVLTAISEYLVYQYANVGFVEQTFLHFELESLIVGIKIAPVKYVLSILLSLMLVTLVVKFRPRINLKVNQFFVVFFVLLGSFFFINFNGTAVGRLVIGYSNFINKQDFISISAEQVEAYREHGINPVYLDVSMIEADLTGQPQNLIIIYLESFSREFIYADQYPKLTPRINELIVQHGEFTNYQSTAKYTLQGIISSLCGLVPKINSGNNLSADQIPYQSLPCITDILSKLGYHQEFFGGARKSFANKEAFLLSKSYDRVWGWLDYEKPSDYKTNDWGLQDSDLFDAAFDKINTLSQNSQSFHVSLLTLSTHLNGNPDPQCPTYTPPQGNGHKFLDGIHCTDYLLGQFVDKLQSSQILDNTTVFITSDHGVFNVSLIKDLFGANIDVHQLFGLIINGHAFDKSLPLGLYDMPPLLLDALEIDTNVNFINGKPIDKIKPDRFILRESDMISGLKNSVDCHEDSVISPPYDKCEVDRLITKTWQHAASFSNYKHDDDAINPQFELVASLKNNQSVFTINDESQLDLFLLEGYPVTSHERKFHDHLFLLVYDTHFNQILERSAFRLVPNHDDFFKQALRRHKDNEHAVFLIMTEGSKHSETKQEWIDLFEQLNSQYFNYPDKPYLAILKFKENTPVIQEWKAKDYQDIKVSIDDFNQYD